MKKMGKRLMSVALALTMMVGIMWGRPIKAEARELLTNNVIFVVVNGAWNDGTTEDIIYPTHMWDDEDFGPVLTMDEVPAVGLKPNPGYKGGEWDIDPTSRMIRREWTFTFTYTECESATINTVPSAKELTFTGAAQELVTAGEVTNGELKYALGSSSSSEPTSGWSETVPSATDAGTYYVWYQATGDDTHSDTTAVCIAVKIKAEEKEEPTPIEEIVDVGGDEDNDDDEDSDDHGPKEEVTVSVSPFAEFITETVELIRNAPKNSTVVIRTSSWLSFNRVIMEEIAKRPDVTVEIYFLEKGHKGKRYKVTIPKGTDTIALLDKKGYTGFLFLGKKFGLTSDNQ